MKCLRLTLLLLSTAQLSAQDLVRYEQPPAPTQQAIVQPASSDVETQFNANNVANVRYVTAAWNWLQTDVSGSIGNLGKPGTNTLTLTPCPLGIDVNSASNHYLFKVYIANRGTPEAALVTGGNCTPGLSSGTITVTTLNAHAAGFTVGSASTGQQEAINDAWVSSTSTPGQTQPPFVKLSANSTYAVHSRLYMRGRNATFDGSGSTEVCSTRDACMQIGNVAGNEIGGGKISNTQFASSISVDGVQVSSVSATSGTYTVTTAATIPYIAGDWVDCEYHMTTSDQHWTAQVLSAGLTSTTFEVSFGRATFPAGSGFGWCNLENTAIEDQSEDATVEDVQIFQLRSPLNGSFSYGIIDDNDQNFSISRIRNSGTSPIKSSVNWPIGAMFYSRSDQRNAGIMNIHYTEIVNNNYYTGGSNGVAIDHGVCEGEEVFCIRYFGGYQPMSLDSMYFDQGSTNPLYGSITQMAILTQGGRGGTIKGNFPLFAAQAPFVSGGAGATQRNYFVVPHSSTQGSEGYPIYIGSAQPATRSTNVTLTWPSIDLQDGFGHNLGTLAWDILVTIGQGTLGTASAPFGTGNFALATATSVTCSNGMCSFTDTQPSLSPYTVATTQGFAPVFWFWPGLIINNSSRPITPTFVDWASIMGPYITAGGAVAPSVIASYCYPLGNPAIFNPVYVSCAQNGNLDMAYLPYQAPSQAANSKGALNFGPQLSNTPNDIITLVDSNNEKTKATAGNKPANDAADGAIGTDQSGSIFDRANISISRYIGENADNATYKERLTSTSDLLNLPADDKGFSSAPGNPATGYCRRYYNTTTGVETWINSSGGNCGPSGAFPSNTVGEEVAGNGGSTGTAIANTVKSGAISSPTLQSVLADCPSSPTPCYVTLDPGVSMNVCNSATSCPAVIGSTTQQVIVEGHGATLTCNGTNGSDCIEIGDFGSLVADAKDGSSGGNFITSTSGFVGTSLVTNAVKDGTNTDFTFEGWDFQANANATVTRAELWIVAINGKGTVANTGCGGITNTPCVSIEDGTSTGGMHMMVFKNNAWYGNGKVGSISLQIISGAGTGQGSNLSFDGLNVGDGDGGAGNYGCGSGGGAMICIDGSAAWTGSAYATNRVNHFLQGITFRNVYAESLSKTAGNFIEIKNAKVVNFDTAIFNGAGILTNCFLIDSPNPSSVYSQQIHFTAWVHSSICANTVDNIITGTVRTSSAQPIMDYTYPGTTSQNPTGTLVDGPFSPATLDQVPQRSGFSYAGKCSMAMSTTCTFRVNNPPATALGFVSLDPSSTPPATAISATCSYRGTTATIIAGASNSLTWDCMFVGAPN